VARDADIETERKRVQDALNALEMDAERMIANS
jgi:hypothetical protein